MPVSSSSLISTVFSSAIPTTKWLCFQGDTHLTINIADHQYITLLHIYAQHRGAKRKATAFPSLSPQHPQWDS